MNVVMVFGIAGASRRVELANLLTSNIKDKENIIIINIPDTKTKISRTLIVISDDFQDINFLGCYRKHTVLRLKGSGLRRFFFVKYKRGKCLKQPFGINTIGKFLKFIAEFLTLPKPESYTGHSFRRLSATILANAGDHITTVKRYTPPQWLKVTSKIPSITKFK